MRTVVILLISVIENGKVAPLSSAMATSIWMVTCNVKHDEDYYIIKSSSLSNIEINLHTQFLKDVVVRL